MFVSSAFSFQGPATYRIIENAKILTSRVKSSYLSYLHILLSIVIAGLAKATGYFF